MATFTSNLFPATLTISHSNFGSTDAHGGTPANGHFNTDATDQHTPPALVNPGAGNFRELAASPTIDAGITSPANGAADLDGRPRTVNGKTDIGAYERGTPITPVTLRPHGTKITKTKIRVKKRRATFRFKAKGTVKGFKCALTRRKTGKHAKKPKRKFKRCRSPKTYKHLRHGRYVFAVRAFNSAGVDRKPATRHFKV
jgi:hypothetical protein